LHWGSRAPWYVHGDGIPEEERLSSKADVPALPWVAIGTLRESLAVQRFCQVSEGLLPCPAPVDMRVRHPNPNSQRNIIEDGRVAVARRP
jgi:hypothetical protein